jgi:hypothetical protein
VEKDQENLYGNYIRMREHTSLPFLLSEILRKNMRGGKEENNS